MKKLSYVEIEERREKRMERVEHFFSVFFEITIGAIAFLMIAIGALMTFFFMCYHSGVIKVIATTLLLIVIFSLRGYLDWRDQQKAKKGDYDPDDLDWGKINQEHYPSA
jgi:purine-cytosine permease-like protein